MADVRLITIGGAKVGLRGLDEAVAAMAEGQWADRPDDEVAAELLRRLEPDNYIPAKASEQYGRALLGHFRRAMGQPAAAEAGGLEVRVLGMGCAQCARLTELAMRAAAELGLAADVEHVTELRRIAEYGVVGSPALIINGRAVWTGSVPPLDKIKQWLLERAKPPAGNVEDA